jgi:hypothetical protein
LGETHRTTGITEVGVARVVKEGQELLDLFHRGRRSRLLTESHGPQSAVKG